MQKFWNIASPIIIIGLGVWIFFLIRANKQWKELMAQAVKRTINNNTQNTPTPENNVRTNMSGEKFWDEMKKGISEMTVDFKFNNNQ